MKPLPPGRPTAVATPDTNDWRGLQRSLETLRAQMSRRGPLFWPKEEAIQGWWCAALRQELGLTGLSLVQELHFGEATAEADAPFRARCAAARQALKLGIPDLAGTAHVRFDLVVLRGEEAGWDGRNLESCASAPRIVAEMKALNSAAGLGARALNADLRKLRAVQRYLVQTAPDEPTLAVLVIVATAFKDAVDADGRPDPAQADAKFAELLAWVQRDHAAEPGDPPVEIAILLNDRVVYARCAPRGPGTAG